MLHLVAAFAGPPSTRVLRLNHVGTPLAVYGSGSSVVLLDVHTRIPRKILTLGSAFGPDSSSVAIGSIAVDPERSLIVASSKNQIAFWTPSQVDNSNWIIHSTLSIKEDIPVTALHCALGTLAVGTSAGLLYFGLTGGDFPSWTLRWRKTLPPPTQVAISPNGLCVASTSSREPYIRIHSAPHARQTQTLRHPLPIRDFTWRSSLETHVLYTTTSDDTLRIYMPVLDSPFHLQLHESVDPDSFFFPEDTKTSSIFLLEPAVIRQLIANEVDSSKDLIKLEGALDAGHDIFARLSDEGLISVTAIANIDRKPPTLLKQYSVVTPTSIPTLLPFCPIPTHKIPQGDTRKISRFVRTPAGHGVAVVRRGGGEVWRRSTLPTSSSPLERTHSWDGPHIVAVMDSGRRLAAFHPSPPRVTLSGIGKLRGQKELEAVLPEGTDLAQLVALLSAPGYTSLIGITTPVQGNKVLQIRITPSLASSPEGPHTLTLYAPPMPLPLPDMQAPRIVLPVDPMVADVPRDVLLSVAEDGTLAFWSWSNSAKEWKSTGGVKTWKAGVSLARCSSMRKTVLVVPGKDGGGDELTIWDSKVSEFSYGLEFRAVFGESERINDLDWTSNASSSILAVGFDHTVRLLAPQRMTYFEQEPAWHIVHSVDLSHITSHPISDSIWLAGRGFLVGAGPSIFLYGQPDAVGDDQTESLFDLVARENAPLDDYHPQMLLQCLLWGKIELVKTIITRLALALEVGEQYQRLQVEEFLRSEQDYAPPVTATSPKQYSFLFNRNNGSDDDDQQQGFSRILIDRLIAHLTDHPLPHFSPNEQKHLVVAIRATLEIDEQRRALDECGLRFLVSMRSFYILNAQGSGTGVRERLRYRDMVWAFHSESQELLIGAAREACEGKMVWSDAKAVGMFLWLGTTQQVKDQLEVVARNQYMSGDARDPTACCLLYFALGKAKLVHGLWRQASWHKEQGAMLKFLSNDFTTERWKTAALKNAFALMGKQRFEYAAAFFLLGGSLKDAVNVLVNQVGDFQLAVAITRAYEGSDDGPVLKWLLSEVIVPLAFREGNRWLGSWAFWMLRRRDLAVRILIHPLDEFARSAQLDNVKAVGDPHYDDPSLALMFQQIKGKSLQTTVGSSEVAGQTEFNFVLHTASVFKRMGCHVLALELVQNWIFDRPTVRLPTQEVAESSKDGPPSPVSPRILRSRSSFAIHPRRMANISIDMEIPSIPVSRTTSPIPEVPEVATVDVGETVAVPTEEKRETPVPSAPENAARQAGLGNLMKTAKQDVAVAEFDMGAFNW